MMLTLVAALTMAVGQNGQPAPLPIPLVKTPLGPPTANTPNYLYPPGQQPAVKRDEKTSPPSSTNGNGSAIFGPHLPDGPQGNGFVASLVRAYVAEFRKKDNGDDSPEPARRAMPGPFPSPPMPSAEFQGFPLIGVPPNDTVYPLQQAIFDSTAGTPWGDWYKDSRTKIYGWANATGNWSTASKSNIPTSYWSVPNSFQLGQFVLRAEREADTVQQDHIDWGFRSTHLYGTDYRYMTAGGWFSDQLLRHNRLNGYDPTEQYFDLYIPRVFEGLIIRVGRWVACPDIETQFTPDNYLATHSLLFTFDTYTQTGIMLTAMLDRQWTVQAAIHAGTDMAPWYKGATATGMFGVRWVSEDNKDSWYTVLNNINDARFRRVEADGQFAGHDNYNYIVTTWQHVVSKEVHTKTEAYFMWQRDAYAGGSVSIGPPQSFGGGGGAGKFIPGYSITYGVVNYTMFQLGKNDFLTLRNELLNDPQGEHSGYRNLFSSHTIGWTHNFNSVLQIRPEIGYYHAYTNNAFDLGSKRGLLVGGLDVTWRF